MTTFGDLAAVEVVDKVKASDYRQPAEALASAVARHGQARMLIVRLRFTGRPPDGARERMRLHYLFQDEVAIVGEGEAATALAHIWATAVRRPVETFEPRATRRAQAWLDRFAEALANGA